MTEDGLRVDTCALRETGLVLHAVRAELAAAGTVADPPPEVLGHSTLRERLAHFGAGWDRRRLEVVDAVDDLAAAAALAAESYERLDTELARAVRGEL